MAIFIAFFKKMRIGYILVYVTKTLNIFISNEICLRIDKEVILIQIRISLLTLSRIIL